MWIALLSPLFEPVPPKRYGGVERVVGVLVKELVRQGHEVTLFASGDSAAPVQLIPCAPRALRLLPGIRDDDQVALHRALLERVMMAGEFDVVHNHLGAMSFPCVRGLPVPTVTTVHGRLDTPEQTLAYSPFRDINLVSISNHQRIPFEHLGLRWQGTVYNGIDLDHFHLQTGGNYLAFLGRLTEVKGARLAVDVARRAGLPLKIAAKAEADRGWYDRRVMPLLAGPQVEFVGEVDEEEKNALLGGADALLSPIQWPEPFGLVMIESMACGTPVIALRKGAVLEVVVDGRTGFICDSIEDMAAKVACLDEIDRLACCQHVERNFCARTMADGYASVYARVMAVAERGDAGSW